MLIEDDTEEEFIAEHYWGYVVQRDGGTLEYEVEHPRWRIWSIGDAALDCDVERLYGSEFAAHITGRPASAMLAAKALPSSSAKACESDSHLFNPHFPPLLGRFVQPVHHLLYHQAVLAGRQGFRAVEYVIDEVAHLLAEGVGCWAAGQPVRPGC